MSTNYIQKLKFKTAPPVQPLCEKREHGFAMVVICILEYTPTRITGAPICTLQSKKKTHGPNPDHCISQHEVLT